ncbi:MAG: capsular biosynthesis protein [Clostridium sp.]|nr:capsular biosynthesis protein [Clostridium sp.]
MEEREVDIKEVLKSLQRRWKIVFFVTVLGILISMIVTFLVIEPKYTASTKLFIGKENSEGIANSNNYNSNDIQMYQKIVQTYADIIQTRTLITSAMNDSNVDIDVSDILKNLKVTPKEDTQIIEVRYIDKNPYMAKLVLEAISNEFIKYSNTLISNSNIQIVEEIFLPEKASSPNNTLNIVIGFLFGIVGGVIFALLLEYIDNTFADKKKLEKEIGITVIGDIPSFDMFE